MEPPYFSELLKEMKALRDCFESKERMFGPEALRVYRANVTMDQRRDFPFFPPKKSVWVVNDGPNNVLVALNNFDFGFSTLRRSEVLTFQFARKTIESVNFTCSNPTATADVRMWAFR